MQQGTGPRQHSPGDNRRGAPVTVHARSIDAGSRDGVHAQGIHAKHPQPDPRTEPARAALGRHHGAPSPRRDASNCIPARPRLAAPSHRRSRGTTEPPARTRQPAPGEMRKRHRPGWPRVFNCQPCAPTRRRQSPTRIRLSSARRQRTDRAADHDRVQLLTPSRTTSMREKGPVLTAIRLILNRREAPRTKAGGKSGAPPLAGTELSRSMLDNDRETCHRAAFPSIATPVEGSVIRRASTSARVISAAVRQHRRDHPGTHRLYVYIRTITTRQTPPHRPRRPTRRKPRSFHDDTTPVATARRVHVVQRAPRWGIVSA